MTHARARKRFQTPDTTYRRMVLTVISGASAPLTGRDVAVLAGLTYRQTIDALNALNNAEKVARTGRKFTARWSSVQHPAAHPAAALEQAFKEFFR